MRRSLRLLVAILMAGGVMAGAMSTASAERARQSGTWVGVVERHGNHFDYVGSPCPIEAEVCPAFVARYRIVPLTRAARQALPPVAGDTARLEGVLVTRGDRLHHGVLFVDRVSPAA